MGAIEYILSFILFTLFSSECKNINGDDGIMHKINWPGVVSDDQRSKWGLAGSVYNEENSIIVTSSNLERYRCMIPQTIQSDHKYDITDSLTPAAELLSPLLLKKPCSYRLEAYWTYELCHGKHIRQFHEEKAPGGKVKLQEYYLGYFTEEPNENNIYSTLNPENLPDKPEDVESKTIDGVRTPHFPIEMDNGTPCGLKQGAKRKTKVLYVCHESARNEIMSISETSSCEYEMTVLTPLLCKNPLYKVEESPVNEIYCLPLDGAAQHPAKMAFDQFEMAAEKPAVFIKQTTTIDDEDTSDPTVDKLHTIDAKISTDSDHSLIKQFLRGDFCLNGGSGWWKYEFCYGKHVKQFHDDQKLGRTVITVGLWDKEKHLEWAKNNKAKTIKTVVDPATHTSTKVTAVVAQYYSEGDVCEETGKPREVIVKLKCMVNKGSSHAVSLYLLEPKTCSYILGVESPIICDFLEMASDNGLIDEV